MKNTDRTIFIIKPNYLFNNKKSRDFDKNSPTQANTSKKNLYVLWNYQTG